MSKGETITYTGSQYRSGEYVITDTLKMWDGSLTIWARNSRGEIIRIDDARA